MAGDSTLVERRVSASQYRYFTGEPEPLDAQGLHWLADQICSEDRVHPDRTMSVGWITAQATYELPHLVDRIAALEAEVAHKDAKLATYCDYLESLQPWVWGHERREMVAADIAEVRTALGPSS